MNELTEMMAWIFAASVIGAVIGWSIEEYTRWLRQDSQTRQARRIARQASKDFKRRQRLRLRSIRFWD